MASKDPSPLPDPANPVFVLGLSQRSGTNYLYRALLLHPDCAPSRQPGEDYLLHEADLLEEYVKRVARHWNPAWDAGKARSRDLESHLGGGLLRHLRPESPTPVFVSKTPSVRNLGLLRRFFPKAKVFVLVRDGRDVAESGVRSFGWTYLEGFRYWEGGAQELLGFLEEREDGERQAEVVSFEKLFSDPETEVARALGICGLDPEAYDFNALRNLPVYGSSTFKNPDREVHWEPVPRTQDFSPVGRWENWEPALLRKYDRICGDAAEKLGYSRAKPSIGLLGRGLVWFRTLYPMSRDS